MSKRASNDEAGSMPKKARPDGKDAIVATILEQIRDKTWRAIQRVGHSRRNKPVSTVSVGLPSREIGLLLMNGSGIVTSSNKTFEKRVLYGPVAHNWLDFSHVTECAYVGMIRIPRGAPIPKVTVTAVVEEADVRIEANMITVRVKTCNTQYRG